MSDQANYILWRRGSNSGFDVFYAKDEPTAQEMAGDLIKEWKQKLTTEHYFHLQRLETVPLGWHNYIHRPKRSAGRILKDLVKIGPTFLKNKLRRKLRRP